MSFPKLVSLLKAVLSADNAERAAAESEMDAMAHAPDFLAALVYVSCSSPSTVPRAILLVALSVLKHRLDTETPATDLLGVAKGLLDGAVLVQPEASATATAMMGPQYVYQAAAVVARAVVLLEHQASTNSKAEQQAAATASLSTLLPLLLSGFTGVLGPAASAETIVSTSGAAAATVAAAGGPLARRALALLRELMDALPADSVTRGALLEEVLPTLVALLQNGTTAAVLENPPSALTAACLRAQVDAAALLGRFFTHETLLEEALALGGSSSGGGGGRQLTQQQQQRNRCGRAGEADGLASCLAAALRGGLAACLVGLRLSQAAELGQRVLVAAAPDGSELNSSLPINTILLFLELNAQLLLLVLEAARLSVVGKVALAPEVVQGLHHALRDDAAAYHGALALTHIAGGIGGEDVDSCDHDDSDIEDEGDAYERNHTEDSPLDRAAAMQALCGKVRRCTEARWRLLETAASVPRRPTRKTFLSLIHTPQGLANGKQAYVEINAYFELFLAYAYLGRADAARWERDPNTFLRGEEERDMLWTTRDIVAQVQERHCHVMGDYFTQIALESLFGVLTAPPEGVQTAQLGNDDDWQRREAAMLLMESMLRRCRRNVIACGAADYSPLVTVLLTRDTASANASVAARALALLGTLLTFLAKSGWPEASAAVPQQCASVLPAAVASLQLGGGTPPLLRACACTLLMRLLPLTPVAALREAFRSGPASGQQALLTLLVDPSTKGDMLYLALDVFSAWLCRLRTHTTSNGNAINAVGPHEGLEGLLEPTAHRAILSSWRLRLDDPNVGEAILAVFAEYIRDPAGDDALLAELPWLQQLLSGRGSAAERCSAPDVVRLLALVFRLGSAHAAEATAATVLDTLCVLLLTTDESATLDAASACLASLLRRCPQAESVQVQVPRSMLVRLSEGADQDDGGGSASAAPPHPVFDEELAPAPLTTALLAVVLHTLNPVRPEASLRSVSGVLITIVDRAAHFTPEQLHQLIDAVTHRLEQVRTAFAAQELLAPLAVLLRRHPAAFLDILQQTGMTQRTFACWLPRVAGFSVAREVLRSCDALVALLANWANSGLVGATVIWDSAMAATAGRVKAKDKPVKPTELPLEVAAFLAIGQAAVVLAEQLETGVLWSKDADDENGLGNGLWQESDSDCDGEFEDVEGDEKDWEEEGEDEDGVGNGTARNRDENGGSPAAAASPTAEAWAQREAAQRKVAIQELRSVFGPLTPLLNQYGAVVAPLFTPDELNTVHAFFELILSE